MGGLLWILSTVGTAIALLALWRSSMLAKELRQLKREQYYTESRVKRVDEDIREAVQPLRLHLAAIAAGKMVSPELILNGRLYHDLSALEAQRIVEQAGRHEPDKVLLLDVRTPKEYAVKHIKGAKLLPFEELEARHRMVIPDTAAKVLVYCMAGERSRLACEFLGRQGYTNIYNIKDGIQSWHGPSEGEGEVQFVQIQSRK